MDADLALPSAVVRPSTQGELVSVVKIAGDLGRDIIPYGRGSNVVGAIRPTPGSMVIDLGGLNKVDPIDEVSGTVRAEAGVIGSDLETRLNLQGFTLGHYPQSMHQSTVGGWVAMRATGSFSTGYGGIETRLVGLEVVLPDGIELRLRAGPRSATGPDLMSLFIGSEGTLGVISAATLRIRPVPEVRRFRAYSVESIEETLGSIRNLVQRGVVPAAIRLYDEAETRQLAARLRASGAVNLVIMVLEGPRLLVNATEKLTRQALLESGALAIGSGPAKRWYSSQFSAEWLTDGNAAPGHVADAIEVAAPWGALDQVVAAGLKALRSSADEIWHHFSHFYADGASVYFIFFIRRTSSHEARDAYLTAYRAAIDAIHAAGGSLTHHHGIGQVRASWVPRELGTAFEVLRSVKTALDPRRQMNPGGLGL